MHNRQNDFSAFLRLETDGAHRRVDEVFGHFDLACGRDYRRFLRAHHRVVPDIEAGIRDLGGAPAFQPRAHHLAADLADLETRGAVCATSSRGPAVPRPKSLAEAYGMLYVLEGSRLGGRLLERSVKAGLPRRYLSAAHGAGEWQAFRTALDEWACGRSGKEKAEALAAALLCFTLFEAAAMNEEPEAEKNPAPS